MNINLTNVSGLADINDGSAEKLSGGAYGYKPQNSGSQTTEDVLLGGLPSRYSANLRDSQRRAKQEKADRRSAQEQNLILGGLPQEYRPQLQRSLGRNAQANDPRNRRSRR